MSFYQTKGFMIVPEVTGDSTHARFPGAFTIESFTPGPPSGLFETVNDGVVERQLSTGSPEQFRQLLYGAAPPRFVRIVMLRYDPTGRLEGEDQHDLQNTRIIAYRMTEEEVPREAISLKFTWIETTRLNL